MAFVFDKVLVVRGFEFKVFFRHPADEAPTVDVLLPDDCICEMSLDLIGKGKFYHSVDQFIGRMIGEFLWYEG